MIHLTIDGIPVEVEKGTTILQAARQIGVEIPTLCYLEDVLPDGSCRLCVVEVTNNGRTKFDTACTLRCSEGDEVQTMSEKVVAYRKDTLDLLISDHRVHCFSCEANGDCKLQDYCFEYGVTETHDIFKTATGAESRNADGSVQELDVKDLVSMNMWGLTPDFMEVLEKGFAEFLSGLAPEDTKKEYLLPELVDHLIKNESAEVDVLETKDTWFGVTYQEDKETVMRAFKNLTEAGIYPQGLYQ